MHGVEAIGRISKCCECRRHACREPRETREPPGASGIGGNGAEGSTRCAYTQGIKQHAQRNAARAPKPIRLAQARTRGEGPIAFELQHGIDDVARFPEQRERGDEREQKAHTGRVRGRELKNEPGDERARKIARGAGDVDPWAGRAAAEIHGCQARDVAAQRQAGTAMADGLVLHGDDAHGGDGDGGNGQRIVAFGAWRSHFPSLSRFDIIGFRRFFEESPESAMPLMTDFFWEGGREGRAGCVWPVTSVEQKL
jgi:hypothetical protein